MSKKHPSQYNPLACLLAAVILLVAIVAIVLLACNEGEPETTGGCATPEQAAMDYVQGTYCLDYDRVCAAVHPAMQSQTRASIDTVAAQFAEYHYEFGDYTLGEITQGSETECRSEEESFREAYGEAVSIADLYYVDVEFTFTMDDGDHVVSDGNVVTATVAKINTVWYVIDVE